MMKKELFRQQAANGYVVCFEEACPRRQECLRWLVGEQAPASLHYLQCVNPHAAKVATDHCPHHRPAAKVRMAKGMTRTFTDDMPQRVVSAVRTTLIERYNRTRFFQLRNGSRPIPPALQEEISQLFCRNGWTQPVEFDAYSDEYDW